MFKKKKGQFVLIKLHITPFLLFGDICDKTALLASLFTLPSAGYLISLKDPELALSVEVCLKGQLQAFTCDNHEDEKVLQGLMAKVLPSGRRPTIITSHFLPRVHDTRSRSVYL